MTKDEKCCEVKDVKEDLLKEMMFKLRLKGSGQSLYWIKRGKTIPEKGNSK